MLIYDEKKKQSLRICCMTNQMMVDEDHHVVALVDDVVSDDDPDNLERKVNEDTQPVEEAPTKPESQKEKDSSLQICSSRLRLLGLPKQTHSHSLDLRLP